MYYIVVTVRAFWNMTVNHALSTRALQRAKMRMAAAQSVSLERFDLNAVSTTYILAMSIALRVKRVYHASVLLLQKQILAQNLVFMAASTFQVITLSCVRFNFRFR